MSTTAISKRKKISSIEWESDKKLVIALSAYEILDRLFGAFSKIGPNFIPY